MKRTPESKIINCKICGKEIVVPWSSKKYLCDDCKIYSQKHHFKNIVEQKILCKNPNCQNVVKTQTCKGSKAAKEKRGGALCEYCKSHPKMIDREIRCAVCKKLLGIETVHDTYQVRNIKYIRYCKECKAKRMLEIKAEMVARMKTVNPMFNQDMKDKVSNTLKEKIKNGEISYVSGKDHYLFKGTRVFNADVRSHLYSLWIKPILERDGFRCRHCGSTRNLQVHHIRPLRDICAKALDEVGVHVKSTLITRDTIGNDLYEKALEKAIADHKLEDGITLCKACHEKEDYYYRPYLGEHKK